MLVRGQKKKGGIFNSGDHQLLSQIYPTDLSIEEGPLKHTIKLINTSKKEEHIIIFDSESEHRKWKEELETFAGASMKTITLKYSWVQELHEARKRKRELPVFKKSPYGSIIYSDSRRSSISESSKRSSEIPSSRGTPDPLPTLFSPQFTKSSTGSVLSLPTAVALYEYQASDQSISCKPDEVFTVLDSATDPEWCKVQSSHGSSGWLPMNYLTIQHTSTRSSMSNPVTPVARKKQLNKPLPPSPTQ